MKHIDIWTDGACSGNPGTGGYCAILKFNEIQKVISGNKQVTANNEMELMAVIKGLETIKEPCSITIYSDSAYVVNAFLENWITNWQKNHWYNSKKQPVANKELWLQLIRLIEKHNVKFVKVKGHSSNVMNNLCDEVARNEIMKIK